jgi:hypothetical protein
MRAAKSSRKGSSNVVSSVLLTVISIAAVALFAVFVFSILNRVDFEVVGTPKIIRDSSGKYYLEIDIHNTGTRDIVKLEVSGPEGSGISIGNLLEPKEVLQAGKERSFVIDLDTNGPPVGSQVLLKISAYTSSSSSPDTEKTATAVVTQV